MKTIPDCIPDALALVLEAARMVSEDNFIHRKVLRKVMTELTEDTDSGASADALTLAALQTAYRTLGVKDPYEKEKARHIRAMLGLEKSFRQLLDAAPNRLSACLNLVLAGASHDSAMLGRADAEREILTCLSIPVDHDDREELVRALNRAERVVYVLNRASDTVLDKLLIEDLGKSRAVQVVVNSQPMLNSATAADADAAGLPAVAEVIDAGAAMLGLTLERASSAFQECFASADVVIVRGEDHYETLLPADREVFFLLRATCPRIAGQVDIPVGGRGIIRCAARQATAVFEAVSHSAQADTP